MQSRQTNRTYELTPINDTELLTVLTEMPLELDQLRILCDLMAMDESVKLSNQTHHNISTIIMEEVRYGTSAAMCFPKRYIKNTTFKSRF